VKVQVAGRDTFAHGDAAGRPGLAGVDALEVPVGHLKLLRDLVESFQKFRFHILSAVTGRFSIT
jgi:hypothetical protein